MYAPIVVFSFNRPRHLRRCLDALAANAEAAKSDLFIYCDGPRNDADLPQTDAVRRVAGAATGFQSVSVRKRERNYGVDPNIVDGVTTVVNKYGRVITVEDDLVTSPYFLRYMNGALNLYADNPKVSCIHGWCFPHALASPPSSFFLRGADNWGWATWKRAWAIFNPDASALLTELCERNLQKMFDLDGAYPYTDMLKKVASGEEEYWDIRWLASAFLQDMYTLYPGRSLVRQIGFDGSGTHCGNGAAWEDMLSDSPIEVTPVAVTDNVQMREEFKGFLRRISGKKSPYHGYLKRIVPLQGMKSLLKDCLPPILLRGIQRLRHRGASAQPLSWQGDFPDWQSAVAASSGYDQEAIFTKVRDAARAVRDGEAMWERDSALFYHEEYNLPLLAALMSVSAWNKGRLRVLDFGGAFGSTYMQHRPLLSKLDSLSWNIVEQSHIVVCGQEEFRTDTLRFWPTMAECVAAGPVDVILFSGVLQYMEDPYTLLEQAAALNPRAIILDRTPFAENGERITVQHVPPEIYTASYPCRWLDRKRMKNVLTKTLSVGPWWQSPVDPLGFQGIMGYSKSDTPLL